MSLPCPSSPDLPNHFISNSNDYKHPPASTLFNHLVPHTLAPTSIPSQLAWSVPVPEFSSHKIHSPQLPPHHSGWIDVPFSVQDIGNNVTEIIQAPNPFTSIQSNVSTDLVSNSATASSEEIGELELTKCFFDLQEGAQHIAANFIHAYLPNLTAQEREVASHDLLSSCSKTEALSQVICDKLPLLPSATSGPMKKRIRNTTQEHDDDKQEEYRSYKRHKPEASNEDIRDSSVYPWSVVTNWNSIADPNHPQSTCSSLSSTISARLMSSVSNSIQDNLVRATLPVDLASNIIQIATYALQHHQPTLTELQQLSPQSSNDQDFEKLFIVLHSVWIIFLLAPSTDAKSAFSEEVMESCLNIMRMTEEFFLRCLDYYFSQTNAVHAYARPKSKRQPNGEVPQIPNSPFTIHINQVFRVVCFILDATRFCCSCLPDYQVSKLTNFCMFLISFPFKPIQVSSLSSLQSIFCGHRDQRTPIIQEVVELIRTKPEWARIRILRGSIPLTLTTTIFMELVCCISIQHHPSVSKISDDITFIPEALLLSKGVAKTLIDTWLLLTDEAFESFQLSMTELVGDLVSSLFRLEYPASEMLLRSITSELLDALQSKRSHAFSNAYLDKFRIACGSMLGDVAIKLSEFRHLLGPSCFLHKRLSLKADGACSFCNESYGGKGMICCDSCSRWYHHDCLGIASPQLDQADTSWYCDPCLLESVTSMIKYADSYHLDHGYPQVCPQVLNDEESIEQATCTAFMTLLINKMKMNRIFGVTDHSLEFYLNQWISRTHDNQALHNFLTFHCNISHLNSPAVWPLPNPSSFEFLNTLSDSNRYLSTAKAFMPTWVSSSSATSHLWIPIVPSDSGSQLFMAHLSNLSISSASIFSKLPKILHNFINLLQTDQAKVRSHILKTWTLVLEADPGLLKDSSIMAAIQARFTDPSALTRENSLALVGRFLASKSDLLPHYSKFLEASLSDTASSVRKRAVSIVQNVCLLCPQSPQVVSLVSSLTRKLPLLAEPQKQQILEFLEHLWFIDTKSRSIVAAGAREELSEASLAPSYEHTVTDCLQDAAIEQTALQVLEVMKHSRSDQERNCTWFEDLVRNIANQHGQEAPRKFREFTSCLVEMVCGIGEHADGLWRRWTEAELSAAHIISGSNEKRFANIEARVDKDEYMKARYMACLALSYIAPILPDTMLHLFSNIRLLIVVDPPTPNSHPTEKKITELVVSIVDGLLFHLKHQSDEFCYQLLKDLAALIQFHGMPVIAVAVRCAATVSRKLGSDNWIRSLFSTLSQRLRQHFSNKALLQSLHLIRYLYTIGLIVKHFPEIQPPSLNRKQPDSVDDYKKYHYGNIVEEVHSTALACWKSTERDVKTAAIVAIGLISHSFPGLFVRSSTESLLTAALSNPSHEQLKAQGIRTISDFLKDEAHRIKEQRTINTNQHRKTEILSTTNADTGLSSTIVDIYIDKITAIALDRSITIRSASLHLVEQVLRLGLTHSMTCVPPLIALETDDQLGDIAHRALISMEHSKVLTRVTEGIQLAFQFQSTVFRTPKAISISVEGTTKLYHSTMGRLYTHFATVGKTSRQEFVAALVSLFDPVKGISQRSHKPNQSSKFDPTFISYLTLLIGQLPFAYLEEILYTVWQINNLLSLHSGVTLNVLELFYENQPNGVPNENDLQSSVICWHLLVLKSFLLSFYAVSKERCQHYRPVETKVTPISQFITTVNMQDWIHERDPKFKGFRISSGWNRNVAAAKQLFLQFKEAAQQEDEGRCIQETIPRRSKKKESKLLKK